MRPSLAWAALLIAWNASGHDLRVVTLDEALWMALESDERIEIQRREVNIAGKEVGRAWTLVTPRLEASGRYERPQESIETDTGVVLPDEAWGAVITARQPLFDGRVPSARRAGLALEAAEMEDLHFTIRSALFDVTSRYYDSLRALEQVRVSEQTLQLSEDEVARAKARFEAGEARRTEVLRAEVDQARAFRNLVAARNNLQLAISDMARRIGLPAHESFTVTAPEPAGDPASEDLNVLYLQALDRRNDLAAARRRERAADEERTVVQRQNWPTLEIQYNHRFVDPETRSQRNDFWDILAVARFDAWDGGARRITRLQQEERIEQARLRVRELEKTIELEIKQALLDLTTLRENLETTRKEVALAEENYRTLSEQARVGLATSLDVSTALNALDQARTEMARQQFDLETAKHNLHRVTGMFADHLIPTEE